MHVVRPQFFTRVFVVGERVTFRSQSGSDVVTGIVERIDPMRTVLRTDFGMPIALPNSAVMNYIVVNQSRLR
jgi:small-conductance mechanosensitive channel